MPDDLDYVIVVGGHNDGFKLIQLAVLMYLKRGWQCCVKGLLKSIPQLRFFFTRWNCKNFAGSDAEKVVDAMIEVCGNYSIPILTAPEKEEFMQVMIILGKYIFRTARIIQILHI